MIKMIVKEIRDEDFTSYKKPSMVIGFPSCTFKCCKEGNLPIEVCQNCELVKANDIDVSSDFLIERYINNPITQAIVCGGMEPLDSWEDLQDFVVKFRHKCNDEIIIYTGYNKDEIQNKIGWLKKFSNIIIKYGRYLPNNIPHYDEMLGVYLASPNQMAEKIDSIK